MEDGEGVWSLGKEGCVVVIFFRVIGSFRRC